jgi:hypothetical protein
MGVGPGILSKGRALDRVSPLNRVLSLGWRKPFQIAAPKRFKGDWVRTEWGVERFRTTNLFLEYEWGTEEQDIDASRSKCI